MDIRDEPEPEELAIGRDQLAQIVVLARAVDAQVPSENPDDGSNPSDDRGVSALEVQRDNALARELSNEIIDLNIDAQVDLVALAWMGRGDFDTLEEARVEARSRREGPTARYLLGMPLLGDLLEAGADAVGVNLTEDEVKILHNPAGEAPAEDDRS
jgi:hypothetical protein